MGRWWRGWLVVLGGLASCQRPPMQLNRPNAVVLWEEQVYVSDFHNQRVVEFDRAGRWVGTLGRGGLERGELWEVWGLAVDASDGALHVLNERPTSNRDDARVREIKVFRGGREVRGAVLHGPHGQTPPWSDGVGLAPEASGWWLAAQEERALVHYGPTGQEQARLSVEGRPSQVRVDAVGGLWVVEQFAHRIRHLLPNGTQTLQLGDEGDAPGQLRFPKAIAECPGAWIVVADMGNYRVQRFTLDGSLIDGFEPPGIAPGVPVQLMDVALSADCSRLYLVDSKGNRVLVTSPEGEILHTLPASAPEEAPHPTPRGQ